MEWVKSRDGTEARRVPDGIEVRMIGKMDSTVYKIKPANEAKLRKDYPALFADTAVSYAPMEIKPEHIALGHKPPSPKKQRQKKR